MSHASMRIGQLAMASGLNVETLRYYQQRGLLEQPPRPLGGSRRYDAGHLERLQFIKAAKAIGFSLDEVGELLRLDDGADCAQAAALAERRLADIRQRLQMLGRMEQALAAAVQECRAGPETVVCPLIASLCDAGAAPRAG